MEKRIKAKEDKQEKEGKWERRGIVEEKLRQAWIVLISDAVRKTEPKEA